MRPGVAHPREKLATLLWSGTTDALARSNLHHTVFTLRAAFGAEASVLRVEGRALALDPASVDVDVAVFDALVAEGTSEGLQRAVALYQGDFLQGFVMVEPLFEEWLLAERERVRELAVEALTKLLARQMRGSETERALQTALRLVTIEPLQEAVHRTLMRLYARQGRRGAALKQYQVCLNVLRRELQAEPEAETKALYQEILREQPLVGTRAAPTDQPTTVAISPPVLDPAAEETPLIGRDDDLQRLSAALDEVASGRGRVIVITGEAGIGKTRLVNALVSKARERDITVAFGRCFESTQVLAFGSWVDALRPIVTADALSGLSPVWRTELSRVLPEIAMGGTVPPPTEDHLRLFEAVVQLLERLTAIRPVLLVLEDLHWADEMTARLLAFVGRRAAGTRLVVIATAREEEISDAPALRSTLDELRRSARFEQLSLRPLSRSDTLKLVQSSARTGLADDTVARLGERVWKLSGGNPFVAVETVRALEEAGSSAASDEVAMPHRVRQLVSGRLDRLSERARSVAAVAAIIGREFDFALLHRASGLEEAAVAEGIEELVRRRVVRGVDESFDFTHDRIRDVTREQIVPPRRKLLHRAVAEAIESLHASSLEPHYAALAMHYRFGEVWDKAVVYLRHAGLQSAARWANQDAVSSYEQALSALARLPQSRETLETAADLSFDILAPLILLARPERIVEYLDKAAALASELNDQVRLGRAYSSLSRYSCQSGEHERALEAGQRALSVAAVTNDIGLEIATRLWIGVSHTCLGDYRRAIDVLHANVDALSADPGRERAGFPFSLSVFSRAWLVWSLVEVGDFAEAIERGSEGVKLADESGRRFDRMFAHLAVGILRISRGDIDDAVTHLEESLALCDPAEFPRWVVVVGAHAGYARVLSGRLDDGVSLLERALEVPAARTLSYRSRSEGFLAEAYLAVGRGGEALDVARRSLKLAHEQRERGNEAHALKRIGDVAAHGAPHDVEGAEQRYREAMTLAEELGMRPLVAHCRLALGELYRNAGDAARARVELTTAVDLYRSMSMTVRLSQAEAALSAVT